MDLQEVIALVVLVRGTTQTKQEEVGLSMIVLRIGILHTMVAVITVVTARAVVVDLWKVHHREKVH